MHLKTSVFLCFFSNSPSKRKLYDDFIQLSKSSKHLFAIGCLNDYISFWAAIKSDLNKQSRKAFSELLSHRYMKIQHEFSLINKSNYAFKSVRNSLPRKNFQPWPYWYTHTLLRKMDCWIQILFCMSWYWSESFRILE